MHLIFLEILTLKAYIEVSRHLIRESIVKKILLTAILCMQAMVFAASSGSSSVMDDKVASVSVKIDPRTFSGVKDDFHYHSNPASEGKLGCLGIRNRDGILEVFNIEIKNTVFQTIMERNAKKDGVLNTNVQTDDWFSISSLVSVEGSYYYGQNITTAGDAVTISSSKGIDLCDAIFVGSTPLVFKTQGKKSSPLFGMVVEPFAPSERPGSIFEANGGALIDGVLEFDKGFGSDYLRAKSFSEDDIGPYFMVAAKSIHFIIKGQQATQ